jgi:hypothetical protein
MSLLILVAIAVLIFAGVSILVIGLASASWQVLLVLLLAVLLIPQWLLRRNEEALQEAILLDVGRNTTPPASPPTVEMKYRGSKISVPTSTSNASAAQPTKKV